MFEWYLQLLLIFYPFASIENFFLEKIDLIFFPKNPNPYKKPLKNTFQGLKCKLNKPIHQQQHCLLSSRLYCRYWNYTSSAYWLVDFYHRSGISPCPEGNLLSFVNFISQLNDTSIFYLCQAYYDLYFPIFSFISIPSFL